MGASGAIRWLMSSGLAVTLLIACGCSRQEKGVEGTADAGPASESPFKSEGPVANEDEVTRESDIGSRHPPSPRGKVYDDYAAAKLRLRLSWTEDLRDANAHGGEGAVPPMFEVIDSGQGVQVTNIGAETVCLDLRRSLAKVGRGLEYQCALWSQRGGLHSCVEYEPGKTEFLRMSSARPDLPDCSGQPLEFRVGTWDQNGAGWWSDVALEEFDRETARLDTDEMLYATLIAVPTEFWKDDFIIEVTRGMKAIPVGAPRVARWMDQLRAAETARYQRPSAAPEERAAQAEHLNAVGEAEARLRAIKSLRERQSQGRYRGKEFPDYLPVEDRLDSVTVTHPLGAVFYVNLSRVGRDPQTGEEFVCEMRGMGRGTTAGTYVSKTVPGNFSVASRSGPCANLENTTLEMVVNDFDGRLTFGTPSALARMETQAEARLRELKSAP